MWFSKTRDPELIDDLNSLPTYGFQFFFKNMGKFQLLFWGLTLASVLSASLKFYAVYLLSELISDILELSLEKIFYFYLPAYLAAVVFGECLDYFTRKYGEAFPTVYGDFLTLRFYRTLLTLRFQHLFNISKERLQFLVTKYVGNVTAFLADWFWGTTRRVTELVIVLGILYTQDPKILAINIIYVIAFMILAFHISTRFSKIAKEYSHSSLETATVVNSFILHLNTVKRLGITGFFRQNYQDQIDDKWARYDEVRHFHAKRWIVQLNLYYLIYVGTLFYGVYQVKIGVLKLGFLILIKYAFDQLLSTLIYAIEYYVSLVQQKEDSKIIKAELGSLTTSEESAKFYLEPSTWSELSLLNVTAKFVSKDFTHKSFKLKIPEFKLKQADKIGIIGESGAGKTTILNILLNLMDFEGEYLLDDQSIKGQSLAGRLITLISNTDPLFNISLKDNILLGKTEVESELASVLSGIQSESFSEKLSQKVGSPDFNLSTGQEQRIRLARGLFNNRGFILLDEPFNGIDLGTKQKIIQFLKNYLKDSTIILVTHNKDELALVDKVYSLTGGVLCESNLL